MHLSLLEHGIYRQLLDLYYLNECALDANALRLICARTVEEVQAAENILNEFFTKTELGWVHKRCEQEIERYKDKSSKAKSSANARWNGPKSKRNANALQTQCEGNANHKPLTINHKPTNKTRAEAIGWLVANGVSENLAFAEVNRIGDELSDKWVTDALIACKTSPNKIDKPLAYFKRVASDKYAEHQSTKRVVL